MGTKSAVSRELIQLIAQHGLEPFLESSRVLAALLDPNGEPLSSNPAFGALTAGDGGDEVERWIEAARGGHAPSRGQFELGGEGEGGRFDCLLIPLDDGRLLFLAEPVSQAEELEQARRAVVRARTEVMAVKAQADEVSHTDALTFLPNRRMIINTLQNEVIRSDRYNLPLTISMLDLDHFKRVNDTYGHTTGDQVLRFVASELRDHIRQPDEVGRYGGEEFLVILPSSTSQAAAEQASRLCKVVRSTPIASGPNEINMTVSIGIAQYRVHEENWEALLNRADQALYQAKHNGRDRWEIAADS